MSGMPLLSRPPPESGSDEPACRKCNKEFNFLFNRMKRCNHCGYGYCISCCDFQALMPRSGADRGYDALPVCFYCIEMLTITASGKNKLRALPLSTLRSYTKAYDIRTNGVLEKDDLVEVILRAKGPNGCLLPAHEDYYRKNSVPQKPRDGSRPRSFLSRATRQETSPQPQPQQRQSAPPPTPRQQSTPHPPPPQQRQHAPPPPQQRQHAPPPAPPRPNARATPPRHQQQQQQQPPRSPPSPQTPFSQPRQFPHNPPSVPRRSRPYQSHAQPSPNNIRPSASQTNFHARPQGAYPSETQSRARPPPPPRPRSAAPTVPPLRPPAPAPAIPSLDALVQMIPDDIAHLPISTLKAILFENRVNTSVGVLEKQDLVKKVSALVTDERLDREIKQREEREEAERMEWARREREKEEEDRKAAERARKLMEERLRESGGTLKSNTNDTKSGSPSSSSNPYPEKEHDGLCVICQDEHANMAIIDCGHLALCKGCSEIVMKSTRECPLCRTRIVTEQRLLRIFKS